VFPPIYKGAIVFSTRQRHKAVSVSLIFGISNENRRQLTIILFVLLAMTVCLDVKNMNRKMGGYNKKGTTTLKMPLKNLIVG